MNNYHSETYLLICKKRFRKARHLIALGCVLTAVGLALTVFATAVLLSERTEVNGETVFFAPAPTPNWIDVEIQPTATIAPNEMRRVTELPGMDVPEPVVMAAEYWGEKYCIAPEFLEAIAFYESSYNRYAENGDCIGLMQVNLSLHKDRADRLGATDIYSITDNMAIATDYLAELFEEYEDPATVLHLYNGDSHANQEEYFSDYADNILELSAALERKAGK